MGDPRALAKPSPLERTGDGQGAEPAPLPPLGVRPHGLPPRSDLGAPPAARPLAQAPEYSRPHALYGHFSTMGPLEALSRERGGGVFFFAPRAAGAARP